MSEIKNVVLVGADGNLGPAVLRVLVDADFTVTVLKRKSSKSDSTYGKGVKEVRVDDGFSVESLKAVLRGQDAVVATIAGSLIDVQTRIADAAAVSGVRHFIPADFGSCDSQSQNAMDMVPLYKQKTQMREHLQSLAQKHPTFGWTSLVCGHFFDWNPAFLHLWPHERRADILDDGNTKFSTSTFEQTANGVRGVLQNSHKPDVRNKLLYIQSFSTTQREIIAMYEKAFSERTNVEFLWNITRLKSGDYIKEQKAKMDAGDKEAMEDVVWVLGTNEADWTTKEDFANARLGLEDEDLEDEVRRIRPEM